jgi:hypothetical protein
MPIVALKFLTPGGGILVDILCAQQPLDLY